MSAIILPININIKIKVFPFEIPFLLDSPGTSFVKIAFDHNFLFLFPNNLNCLYLAAPVIFG